MYFHKNSHRYENLMSGRAPFTLEVKIAFSMFFALQVMVFLLLCTVLSIANNKVPKIRFE